METKKLNTTDPISNLNHTTGSHINNLNQPDAHCDNSNVGWTCRNVPNPEIKFGAHSATNPYQMADAPAISARTASALAPSSTGKVGEERVCEKQSQWHIARDMEASKFLSKLWSREILSDTDKEQIEAKTTRTQRANSIMDKIQQRFAEAKSTDDKQAIMFVIYDTFINTQEHLTKYLNKKYVKPYLDYSSEVRSFIDTLMGPDSPGFKIKRRKKPVMPDINRLFLSENPTTSHNGFNGSGVAREHDDTHAVVYGTKDKFPVQESGYKV